MAVDIKRVTVEEFERFMALPENAERRFEYIRGEIVEVVSNSYSSECAANIIILLGGHVKRHKLGRVTAPDGGYIIFGERYIPDVAFISQAKQPEPSHAAYNPTVPDLVVEVLSPTDSESHLRVKVANYVAAGARVWVVDPQVKTVEDYVPGQSVQTFTADDTLDGGDLLAGFRLPVRDIFPD